MKTEFLENYDELLIILRNFFDNSLTRNSIPMRKQNWGKEAFDIACKIYKRGFVNNTSMDSRLRGNDLELELGFDLIFLNIFKLFQKLDFFHNEAFYIVDKNFLNSNEKMALFLKNKPQFILENPEQQKNLSTIKQILTMLPYEINTLVIIGGGAALDIGGFVAGLAQIQSIAIPTTLLAAVDATVGGKTGVNFYPYGKNQVGLFYQPSAIYFCASFLNSLNSDQIICGLAECAKHSYLMGEFENDATYFYNILENRASEFEISAIVEKNIRIKMHVVKQDEFDVGLRMSLNFGHTLAHVLEGLCELKYISKISHGQAVLHGMNFLMEIKLIEHNHLFHKFINHAAKNIELNILNKVTSELIEKFLSQDKKNLNSDYVNLVCPKYGILKSIKKTEFLMPMNTRECAKKMLIYIERGN